MLHYTCKSFSSLSLEELYETMVLRQDVFVVEQDCAYLDADNKDQHCHHILGKDDDGHLHSYARLVPIQISYEKYSSIGRVITSADYRGMGEGKRLMIYSIEQIKLLYPTISIKISAQVYALPFYRSVGFVETGDRYDEDGIPHASMVLI